MSWENFKQYLKDNIFEEKGYSENYKLTDGTQQKYSITNPEPLITSLTNLIESISNESSEDYHQLPEIKISTVGLNGKEKIVLKTWSELFPNRTKTFFGDVNSQEVIDLTTFKQLEAIYTDYCRPIQLKESLEEDQLIQFIASAAINLTYDTIKRQGVDKMLERWLTDYDKLNSSEQENSELLQKKTLVSQLLGLIKAEEKHRSEKGISSWLPNWNWKSITWYGGGGLLIILVFGYLWKKLRDK